MRKIKIGLLCAMLIAPSIARADDAERHQLAEKLLLLTDIQKNTEKSFDMIKKMIAGQTQQALARSGATNSAEATAQSAQIMDTIFKEFSWDKMKDDYVNMYAETFTEDELKGIIAFYESPAGQKFTAKQPELMQRSMALSQKKMAEIMPMLQQFMKVPHAGPIAVAPPISPSLTKQAGETSR